ncbi:MAG TPA: HlyD family efflux transporter periplasmic adaptor subunit, partial [Vicinamibacterales bacterium]|nr:HlyD family efflux transporter periplasmic adaptor subunit [Vicinamibacterales bacterium]
SILAVVWIVPGPAVQPWPTAVVREAAFTESIVESGAIGAQRMMIYSNRLAGTQAKIVEIAAEGSSVQAGDLLVRFDPSGLEQAVQKDEAALRQEQSELLRAREDLRLERLRAQTELDAARQDVIFADRDLTNELEGRGTVQVAEAQAAAAEAARELERTRRAHDDARSLLDQQFVTRSEVERAEHAWRRAGEVDRIARLKLESLTRYERPAAVEQSRARLHAAGQASIRLSEGAAARLAQRGAAVALMLARTDEIEMRLRLLREQIANTTIRADGSGLVVYRDLFFGSDKRKPQVGDEVWPNQPIIALPDSSQLIVETRVREADLHKVAASQRVVVRVDAYPQLRLAAAVTLVGALAAQDESRAGTKYFPVTVKLLESDSRLRTGMTARVDIEVASLAHALVVPAQAVFMRDGYPICYVLRNGTPELRTVEIAGDNGVEIGISRGLMPGETVLLSDPTAGR